MTDRNTEYLRSKRRLDVTAPTFRHYIGNTRSTPGRINECKSINPPSGVPERSARANPLGKGERGAGRLPFGERLLPEHEEGQEGREIYRIPL